MELQSQLSTTVHLSEDAPAQSRSSGGRDGGGRGNAPAQQRGCGGRDGSVLLDLSVPRAAAEVNFYSRQTIVPLSGSDYEL